MTYLTFLTALLMLATHWANAQVTCREDACPSCNDYSVDDTNLFDLGTGTYRTLQGGLYPQGTNTRPSGHNTAGLAFADGVVPLDANGNPDYVDGKIVLVSIGFSNANYEFCFFQNEVAALQMRNPYLVVVNCAIGGWPIEEIIDEEVNDLYWYGDSTVKGVEDFLADAGVTWDQVQAVWFKTANKHPDSSCGSCSEPFLDYIHGLRNQYVEGMELLHEKFENCHLCYLSDRTFGGYGNIQDPPELGSPEPFAYWTGWAVKRLIEYQLNGSLPYSGEVVSPWLSWGPYLWADGENARTDGLQWFCEDFRVNEGKHPSDCGKEKVAVMLRDFFKGDETTRPWFLRTRLINAGGDLYVTADKDRFGEDDWYVGGAAGSTSNAISGTDEDALYQEYREGTGSIFGYDLPVPNSASGWTYHVKLHFSDPDASQAGDRVFDVKCENVIVKNDLDIFDEANGANTAYVLEFDHTVSDEELSIKFVPQSGFEPLICAIEVDYINSSSRVTSAGFDDGSFPVDYQLAQNYPNPFNPETTIRYSLKSPAFVTVKIFDILGNEVETLVAEQEGIGEHGARWNARGQSSGVYFYRIEAGEFRETKRLIVLK